MPAPFTPLSIKARCDCTDDATIIGFREGGRYPLQARYEFPAETPNYEVHWLTKDGRVADDGGFSVYDLTVVQGG